MSLRFGSQLVSWDYPCAKPTKQGAFLHGVRGLLCLLGLQSSCQSPACFALDFAHDFAHPSAGPWAQGIVLCHVSLPDPLWVRDNDKKHLLLGRKMKTQVQKGTRAWAWWIKTFSMFYNQIEQKWYNKRPDTGRFKATGKRLSKGGSYNSGVWGNTPGLDPDA